ncbi:unnamed protein product [Thelazia callipaeda]|uniref:DnaA_N domain-containing protein n=1 Tax=Thelazia callipaeda TaxID=103827 RepID=A0A0N5D0D4_THECL|nr:unnamed protein product [Thelazia callipaeda]
MHTINIRCNWDNLEEIRRDLCHAIQRCDDFMLWKNVTFGIARYKNDLHFSIKATINEKLKSELEDNKQQYLIAVPEKEQQIQSTQKSSSSEKSEQLSASKLNNDEKISVDSIKTKLEKAEEQPMSKMALCQDTKQESPKQVEEALQVVSTPEDTYSEEIKKKHSETDSTQPSDGKQGLESISPKNLHEISESDSLSQESGKESSTDSKKTSGLDNLPTNELKQTSNTSKYDRQTLMCDVGIQTDFDDESRFDELSEFGIVLFAPSSQVKNETRWARCIQVGKGDIQMQK